MCFILQKAGMQVFAETIPEYESTVVLVDFRAHTNAAEFLYNVAFNPCPLFQKGSQQ
jgi:hypothetical protein